MKQTHRPTHKHRRGFTIVELVIVIAVIGILATVLVPTFGDVINNAKDSAAKQEAKNAYTEYIADAAANGNVADYCVYEADANRFVAIANGAVVGVYETQDAALSAMVNNPTGALVDTGDGKLFAYGGEEDDNQTPVAPTVYSLCDEQLVNAMKTKTGAQTGNGVGSVMWATSTMSALSGKTVTKIAAQFAVTDNTKDCVLTVRIVSTDGKTKIEDKKITVDGTKFTAANKMQWFEIDNLNITLAEGQTISIGPDDNSDSVKLGYVTGAEIAGPTLWYVGKGTSPQSTTQYTSLFNVWYVD